MYKSVLRFLLSIAFIISAPLTPLLYSQNSSWTSSGPNGGHISCLTISPSDPNILYMGSGEWNHEGHVAIFKVQDKWDRGDPLISLDNKNKCGWRKVNRILVDPDSSNVIYAAGINSGYCPTYGGILISQDSGVTWKNRKIGTDNFDEASNITIVKNSLGKKTLFAIQGGSPISFETKLMKSPDMGNTWEEVDIPYTGKIDPNVLLTDPKDQGRIIIGSTNAGKPLWLYNDESGEWDYICGGIHRHSGNKGSWEKINSGINNSMVNDFVVDPDNKSIYATTMEELKLSKSTDNGTSWEIQPSNLSAAFDILTIDPNHPSTFWAAKSKLSYYNLYKGESHGQLWTGPISFINGPAIGNYTEISDILVKPGDSNTILVSTHPYFLSSGLTGFGALVRTTDGGNHWKGFSVPGSCLAMDPSDPDIFYMGKERAGQVYLMEVDGASSSLSNIEPEGGIEDVQDP